MPRRDALTNAEIEWGASADGDAPFSVRFGDVYFSAHGGPAETAHVFLEGNALAERFARGGRFSIGELGFGTGLNFLCAWELWRRTAPPGARLDFVSVEGFPLAPAALERAHANWPALAPLSATLRAALPPPLGGTHRVEIAPDVTLTLLYGEAGAVLCEAEAEIDAWFLDGFSPAKNPEMWRDAVLTQVARLSTRRATFATYTVAGPVRRGLAACGFSLARRPGFANKREMLTGRLDAPPPLTPPLTPVRAPWFDTRTAAMLAPGARVAVVGAGIAGASLAHALTREGFAVSVYDADGPAAGASGNAAGLVAPRLSLGDTPAGRFHALAFVHTTRLLRALDPGGAVFNPCGVLQLEQGPDDAARFDALAKAGALPVEELRRVDAGEASALAGLAVDAGGLWVPSGSVVRPGAFVTALLGDTPVRRTRIREIALAGKGWRLTTDDETAFDAVVFANAMGAGAFEAGAPLPLSGSLGQIEMFANAPSPRCAVTFGSYAAPFASGLVCGATYAPWSGEPASPTHANTEDTLAKLAARLPTLAAGLRAEASTPRAAVRCVTPDRIPIAGPLPDWTAYRAAYAGLRTGAKTDTRPGTLLRGLYTLTGLGSRGLVTAPLAAALIAAEMSGAPAPVDAAIAESLHPARFLIRDLKRRRA